MINNTTEKELNDFLMDREGRKISQDYTVKPIQLEKYYPDAKKHQIVSFIKSGIRILGYVLIPFDILWAAGILILSEVVGIIEELVYLWENLFQQKYLMDTLQYSVNGKQRLLIVNTYMGMEYHLNFIFKEN